MNKKRAYEQFLLILNSILHLIFIFALFGSVILGVFLYIKTGIHIFSWYIIINMVLIMTFSYLYFKNFEKHEVKNGKKRNEGNKGRNKRS